VVYGDIESYHEIEDPCIKEFCLTEETDTRVNKVIEAIKHLPEVYRNIVSLYLFDGYDHEEISEILSIPSSTSRSQFSRARKRILKEFGSGLKSI
jgi:RNA polymerase sigma-70 factor (ECF subfamily)